MWLTVGRDSLKMGPPCHVKVSVGIWYFPFGFVCFVSSNTENIGKFELWP